MLDKHYEILNKIKSLTKNDLDVEPVYNNKTLNNKVKFYKHIIKADFHNKELPPKKSLCMARTMNLKTIKGITLKHFEKTVNINSRKKKLIRYINEVLTDFDSDSDCKGDNDSDPDFDSDKNVFFVFIFSGEILKVLNSSHFSILCFIFSSLNFPPFFLFVHQLHHISGLLFHLTATSPWLFVHPVCFLLLLFRSFCG